MRSTKRLILVGGVLLVLLLAGAVTLVVKTRPRGVGAPPDVAAAEDETDNTIPDLPRDPNQRAALVADFAELADAIHRLQGFWGNTEAQQRAERALAAVKAKGYVTTQPAGAPTGGTIDAESAFLIGEAEQALAEARKAHQQAHDAIDALDHEAGIHKDAASQPSLFPNNDFEVAEQRGAATGKSASYHARAFFNRYDELRGEHVR